MYERILHLKVEAVEIYRYLERKSLHEGLEQMDGAWWGGKEGHGFLLFRRPFLRVFGKASLLMTVETVTDRVSRVKLVGYAPGWLDAGVSEITVAQVIRWIRRYYTDGCLEQVYEEVWRNLVEIGFTVNQPQWRKKGPPLAVVTAPAYRGVVSVRLSRDGCADELVLEFVQELEGLRQHDPTINSGILVVNCPERVARAPFLTKEEYIRQVERAEFTLVGFRRLQEILTAVRTGKLPLWEAQKVLRSPGVLIISGQEWAESAAARE